MARFVVKEAVREKVYPKINIAGAAGSGKTYGALLTAKGMAKEIKATTGRDAKILMGNTEASRGRYYANEFTYDIADLEAPYNPELFIELIDYAVDNKYDILIIDSSSHEWDGKGGCLELQQQAGGTFQAWKKVTPRHSAFIDKIVSSPITIIATSRSKAQYEIEKDERGKASVTKVGTGIHQREGYDYEFTCFFNIDVKSHMATAEKDNTHLFSNGDFMITEQTGINIMRWANSSNIEPEKTRVTATDSQTNTVSLDEIKKQIVSKAVELGGTKNKTLMDTIKEFVPSGNPNAIGDVETAQACLEKLNTIGG